MRRRRRWLRAAGVDAFGVPLDVTDDESVAAAARLIERQAGRLDVLVNNAGVSGGMPQDPTRVSPEQVRVVVEANVIGVIRVTNALLRRPRGGNRRHHLGGAGRGGCRPACWRGRPGPSQSG